MNYILLRESIASILSLVFVYTFFNYNKIVLEQFQKNNSIFYILTKRAQTVFAFEGNFV